jgi:nucleoside-diphosphate-sugar epimerase
MKYPSTYIQEIKQLARLVNRSYLLNQTIVISGATGMILSYFIDTLLIDPTLPVSIIALVRNETLAQQRFSKFKKDPRITFKVWHVNEPLSISSKVDFVIHGASTTDPKSYQSNPVETMTLNFVGTYHMLELAKQKKAKFLLLSSTEVYGQLPHQNPILENELGYLNLQDPRSSYNEGKRAAETLCASFYHQHQVPVVIARLSRVYGPTLKLTDTKAFSQFLMAAAHKQPIVLKSEGLQKFSYLYVADAVQGLLLLLQQGQSNEAYNLAHPEVFTLKEIATLMAKIAKVPLKMEISQQPQLAYSKTVYAIQSVNKILTLGFQARIGFKEGIKRTLALLKKMN